ncbi:MAG: sensor histidine kinase [Bacteroidia bacterium]
MNHITYYIRLSFPHLKMTGIAVFLLLYLSFSVYSQSKEDYTCSLGDENITTPEQVDSQSRKIADKIKKRTPKDYHCADSLAQELQKISARIGYYRGVGKQICNRGRIRRYQGKYEEAHDFYQEAMAYREKHGLRDAYTGYTLQEIGLNYRNMGFYAEAIEAHLEAIQYFREESLTKQVGEEYNNIGASISEFAYKMYKIDSTFNRDSALRKGIVNYKKAFEIAENGKNWSDCVNVGGNIGRDYVEIGELDSAAFFLNNSMDLCRKILDTITVDNKARKGILNLQASTYGKLGHLYEKQKSYDLGLEQHTAALAIYRELNDSSGIFTALTNIGNNYEERGDNNNALIYYKQAYQVGEHAKIDQRQDFLRNKNLYVIYAKLKDTVSAYPYLLAKADKEQQIAANEMVQNVAFAENNGILKAEAEKEKANAKLKNQMLMGSGIVLILLILGIIQQLQLRKTQKKQATLEVQQKAQQYEARIDLIMDESRQRLIAKQNETQEIVLKEVGRELHDSLGGTLATTKRVIEEWMERGVEEEAIKEYGQKALELIQRSIDGVRQISRELKGVTLKDGLIPGIRELCREINEVYARPEIKLQTYNLKTLNIPAKWEINIYRIFQEALTNILKYAEATNVEIQMFVRDEILSVTIEDDGKGFDIEKKAEGIGLKNMKSRAEEMKGTFTISSVIDRGTTLFIEIPLPDQFS